MLPESMLQMEMAAPEISRPSNARVDADDPARDRLARALLCVVLALTVLVYLNTLRFDFVFDDIPQIVENTSLHSWNSVPWFFTHHVWQLVASGAAGNFYRPLFLVWFVLNYKLFGLNPAAWHATTLLVHLAATSLVFLLARRLLRNEFAAAVAALVFGLHPGHIETVAWASGVTDSLLTVFFTAAFLAYLRARDSVRHRAAFSALALLCFACALLVKEPAIVLPALIFVYEWLNPDSAPISGGQKASAAGTPSLRARAALLVSLPFGTVAVVYLAVRYAVLHGFTQPLTVLSWRTMLLTWPSIAWFYVVHLVWPFRISEFYETPYIWTPSFVNFWLPLALVLVVIAAACWWARRSSVAAFALCWILLPLAPAFNLQTFQWGELAHDRYLYLSSVGFALLVALAIENLRARRATDRNFLGQPWPIAATLLTVAIAGGLGTAMQNSQWASTLLLYTRGFEVAPNNIHTVAPLSRELMRRRRYAEAIPLLERATRLAPNDWDARFTLGHTCFLDGRYADAERYLLAAIELDSHSAAEYLFLGLSRLELHRPEQAVAPLRRATELLPSAPRLHSALARALEETGDIAGARAELAAELRIDPANDDARRQLTELSRK